MKTESISKKVNDTGGRNSGGSSDKDDSNNTTTTTTPTATTTTTTGISSSIPMSMRERANSRITMKESKQRDDLGLSKVAVIG